MKWTFRPLGEWPGRPAKYRQPSQFRAAYLDTLELLNREIAALDGTEAVIQLDLTEAELRIDGMLRADARPRTPGVVLSFSGRQGSLQFMTDRYDDWRSNLRAIALGLEALRAVDRYGITRAGEQYRGWRQLSQGSGDAQPEPATDLTYDEAERYIRKVAGVGADVPMPRAYRQAAKRLHPDVGGDAVAFRRLQEAKAVVDRYGSA